jgi:hypothetical protein
MARFQTTNIDESTIIYAASFGAPDCDPVGTVIGFSPTAVDECVAREVESAKRYDAESCEIENEDGSWREAEPGDFEYWITDAMEVRIGDIITDGSDEWDDAMDGLRHYGYATISRP